MRPFFFIFTCFNGYSRYRHIKAEVYLNILHTLSAGLVGFVDDDLVDQFVHDLRLSCQILSCRFCKREVLQIVGILNGVGVLSCVSLD